MSYDAIVVGGGVIGMCVARSLARDRSVLLLERGFTGRESSWAAAGMLCPYSEAEENDPLLELSLESLALYRDFSRELLEETGVDIEYRDEGAIVLASDTEEHRAIRSRCDWMIKRGLDTSMLSADEVRRREPHLTLEIEGAMYCPGDHQVRPRRLTEALHKSCVNRGVEICEQGEVEEIVCTAGRLEGVRTVKGSFAATSVIVTAGAWASQIKGLRPSVPIRPRKGQILSLQMPGLTFRHLVRWGRLYLVPRNDGELVVGATNEDNGFDRKLTASGLSGLLAGAQSLSAEIGDYPVLETWTGLRPMTGDGLPAIGRAAIDGLIYALGHYRNGILLAPATAQAIDALVRGQGPSQAVAQFTPARFNHLL